MYDWVKSMRTPGKNYFKNRYEAVCKEKKMDKYLETILYIKKKQSFYFIKNTLQKILESHFDSRE